MKNRVQSLDYLRGLMAFGIMIYHYMSWTVGSFTAASFLGRIGIYGVSIFYVLSGLTLFLVYSGKLKTDNLWNYIIKRIFRIFPLLWLSIFLSILILGKSPELKTLILNLTGLFGFIAHDQYIATASWSIGNELVFYAFFPFVILLSKKTRFAPLLFFLISAAVSFYFAFFVLTAGKTLATQWKDYVNPLNQVVLFSGGILTGQWLAGKKIPNPYGIAILLISFLTFIFYPVTGDQSSLIAGLNRVVFVMLAFAITSSFLMIDFKIGKIAAFLLSRLGEASYSVYLLHPIVYALLKTQAGITDTNAFLITAFSITLLLSFLVYSFFEIRFISLGQTLIHKLKSKQAVKVEVRD